MTIDLPPGADPRSLTIVVTGRRGLGQMWRVYLNLKRVSLEQEGSN